MPQISPLSWVFIPFFFLLFLFLVMVGIWWVFLGGYDFFFKKSFGSVGSEESVGEHFVQFFWVW